MKRERHGFTAARLVALPLAATLSVLALLSGLAALERGDSEEGRLRLEESIRRAAVTCYATEGVYPPTLEELTTRCGIRIDRRYTVYYDVFAENLMPEITVLENEG